MAAALRLHGAAYMGDVGETDLRSGVSQLLGLLSFCRSHWSACRFFLLEPAIVRGDGGAAIGASLGNGRSARLFRECVSSWSKWTSCPLLVHFPSRFRTLEYCFSHTSSYGQARGRQCSGRSPRWPRMVRDSGKSVIYRQCYKIQIAVILGYIQK